MSDGGRGTRRALNALQRLEEVGPVIVASVALAVTLADLFGVFEVRWFKERLHLFTLLLLSLLVYLVASTQTRRLHGMRRTLNVLDEHRKQRDRDVILNIRRQLNPDLDAIFGAHVQTLVQQLDTALATHTVELRGGADDVVFRTFYVRTLQAWPRAVFRATSLPTQRYFWRASLVDDAIARFVAGGGKMTRVFFVGPPGHQDEAQTREVLTRQWLLGVDVYTADLAEVERAGLERYFVVCEGGQADGGGRIAWEVYLGAGGQIERFVATADRDHIRQLGEHHRRVMALASCAPYAPLSPGVTTVSSAEQALGRATSRRQHAGGALTLTWVVVPPDPTHGLPGMRASADFDSNGVLQKTARAAAQPKPASPPRLNA